MAKQQSIRDDLDNVQWRVWLIENYTASESIFVYKCHHSIADGIGLILMFGNLVDNPDVKTFPAVTLRFPFWQRCLINLTVPFLIMWISFKQFVLWFNEDNAIKNPMVDRQLTALKGYSICHDIPIDAIKERCKELKVTINEFVFGIISYCMKEHLVRNGDKDTTHLRVAVPFSLRGAPTHELDF